MRSKTTTSRHLVRPLVLLMAALMSVAGVALTVPLAQSAQALCVSQPMQGDWRNIDANTNSITRVVVGFNCGDQILCDENGHCSGGESYFTVRPFGKCHPTDCDWGTRRAYAMSDGWQRAVYSHSWATKSVWIKTYVYSGVTYLRVWVLTDFTAADGRTDYTSDVWMLK